MAAMFAVLENSLKTEMAIIHKDLGHVHTRVEDLEKRLDSHTRVVKEMKVEIKALKIEQRKLTYKMED